MRTEATALTGFHATAKASGNFLAHFSTIVGVAPGVGAGVNEGIVKTVTGSMSACSMLTIKLCGLILGTQVAKLNNAAIKPL